MEKKQKCLCITQRHSRKVIIEQLAFVRGERWCRNMNYELQRGAMLKNQEQSRSEKLNQNFQIRHRKKIYFQTPEASSDLDHERVGEISTKINIKIFRYGGLNHIIVF